MKENLKYTGKNRYSYGIADFFVEPCYAKDRGETVCMQLNYIYGGT